MILWECDGCGTTVESLWAEVPNLYANSLLTADPVPPVGWWTGLVVVVGRGLVQSKHKAYVACSGACMDKVGKDRAAKPGSIGWKQQEAAP